MIEAVPHGVPAALDPAKPPYLPHPLASLAERGALLDPARLAATAEAAARALPRQGESVNTRASYGSAMRYWCAWYAARYGQALALPVPVAVVVQFIVDHAARRPDEEAAREVTEDAPRDAAPGRDEVDAAAGPELEAQEPTTTADALAPRPRAKRLGAAAALITELPSDVDLALVANGYKARLGCPSLNTLVHRVAVLSKAHQMARAGSTGAKGAAGNADDAALAAESFDMSAGDGDARHARGSSSSSGLANPCADPLVRELLARTRRAYAQRGVRPKRQRALTKDSLQAVLATCDEASKGKRDRALLLFAWASGGRRRSEVASATLENLQRIDAGSFIHTLAHSKTNQRGDVRPEDVKPQVGSAAAAMNEWLLVLKAHGIGEGAIFRRIRRGGHLGEPLPPAAVRNIVRERCALAGVEGSFSAHSLRAGFVTEAGRQNMPLPETMAMIGYHSVATVVGYFRAESAVRNKASRLLDES